MFFCLFCIPALPWKKLKEENVIRRKLSEKETRRLIGEIKSATSEVDELYYRQKLKLLQLLAFLTCQGTNARIQTTYDFSEKKFAAESLLIGSLIEEIEPELSAQDVFKFFECSTTNAGATCPKFNFRQKVARHCD